MPKTPILAMLPLASGMPASPAIAQALLVVALSAARPLPAQDRAQPPSSVGWSFYGIGLVSPSGFFESARKASLGVAGAVLRQTGTPFEFGLEALYEHLSQGSSSSLEEGDKLQFLLLARLRALPGTVRPYGDTGLGIFHGTTRFQGSVGSQPYDDRTSGTGLVLALGAGLE